MHAERFDDLTRHFGAGATRRAILASIVALVGARTMPALAQSDERPSRLGFDCGGLCAAMGGDDPSTCDPVRCAAAGGCCADRLGCAASTPGDNVFFCAGGKCVPLDSQCILCFDETGAGVCTSRCCGCFLPDQTLCPIDGTPLCVKTASDPSNCGTCGHACAAGEICRSGQCAACDAGQTGCVGTCCAKQEHCKNGGCVRKRRRHRHGRG